GFRETFITAPSPGVVATAMINQHYSSHDAYLTALSKALANEYRSIHEAGHVLQIDAPDLAMERSRFRLCDGRFTLKSGRSGLRWRTASSGQLRTWRRGWMHSIRPPTDAAAQEAIGERHVGRLLLIVLSQGVA